MAKRPKIGDIIEIPTSKGLAYAQYTHRHSQWGALLRVMPGIHSERPISFESLFVLPEQFSAFFPLSQAINQGLVRVVANAPVAAQWKDFPIFRGGHRDKNGKVADWWLWDGQREWRVGELTPEQWHYPLHQVINDTLLIERIESGWKPELET